MPLAQTRGQNSVLSITLLAWLCIFFVAANLPAQTPSITNVRIGADGRIVLTHTADTNSYYILLRGDQVTAILTAKDMQFGVVGTNQLKDPNIATNAGFYRVRQVPLSNPLDTTVMASMMSVRSNTVLRSIH